LRNAEQELARRAQELPRPCISEMTKRPRPTSHAQLAARLLEPSRGQGTPVVAYQV
jgi:hypothetical protein